MKKRFIRFSGHTMKCCSLTRKYWFGECKCPLTNYSYLAKADMLKTCTFLVTFHASNYDLSLPVPGSEIVGYPKLRKRKRENKTRADIFACLTLAHHLYFLRARNTKGERVDVWPSILKNYKTTYFLERPCGTWRHLGVLAEGWENIKTEVHINITAEYSADQVVQNTHNATHCISLSRTTQLILLTPDFSTAGVSIGSLSNDHSDVNENGKKAIGLECQNTHVQHAFLYVPLPSLHYYGMKMIIFTFCGGHKRKWRT